MGSLAKPGTGAARSTARLEGASRVLCCLLAVAGAVVALAVVALGTGYLRLLAGPLDLKHHSARVGEALADRLGAGWTVTLGDAALELHGGRPAVRTAELEIRNRDGVPVVRAPYGIVSLDMLSLLTGTVSAREIELRDLQLRAVLAQDGALTFMSEEGGAPDPLPMPGPDAGRPKLRTPVSAAVTSLLNPIAEGTGLIGGLDHATVKGARLTLVGPDGRERAAFNQVNAEFERLANGDRRVAVDLAGPHGSWAARGRVREGKNRTADVEIQAVPAGDLLLLAGMPEDALRADLTISGQVSTVFRTNRVLKLEARIESSAGSIIRKRGDPVRIDRLAGQGSWNETARELDLPLIEVVSEGTALHLAGRLASAAEGGWRAVLSGRDAKIAGIKGADRPFTLEEIAAELTFRDGGIALDRGTLRGQDLDISVSGALLPGSDGYRLDGLLEARRSELRRLIRLWPDSLNPGLRRYLADRVIGGSLESMRLRSALTPYDVANLFVDVPLTDGALDLAFSASGVELAAVDGVPHLRGLAVEGRASGTRATLKAPSGRIVMPDGRSLLFSEGSYVHANMDVPNTPAQIAFSVSGGADALASFLRSPALREGIGLDLDPATVGGRAEIKVRLPLVPKRVPTLSEMALGINATLTDIRLERLFGREQLEGGNFAMSYESGALSGRGDAKLGGAPATFEFAAPKTGPGEAAVSLTLDEAARARRSLPVAPQLSGPVPVRITVPIGAGPGAAPRIEADLGRAAIDGLVPGWVKPANRPGRLAFTWGQGEGETSELRDLVAEGGSAHMRGQLFLSGGNLDKADLTTFKLSPGDDMKAQVERVPNGPLRVSLKGNVGDARPILKWIGASPKGGARDGQEVDLDLGLNILTGYNDEALTSVSGKASLRSGELRSAEFKGRFRSASVEASLAKRDAGLPVLTVKSADAGATLRFLDVYRRMIGGRLSVDGRSGDGGQTGTVVIDEFGLRDEPALRSIVSQVSQQAAAGNDERFAPIARSDLNQVPFTRLAAGFRRSGSRFDLNDVSIYGPQVGFNVSGWVDYARDRLDLGGTFVPAFALNNAFSHIPVVGLVLGGGATEGLIAVDFRVAGPIASPNLSVNPLTAVTPGILRKFFGWMMPEGEAPPSAPARTTGTATPRAVR